MDLRPVQARKRQIQMILNQYRQTERELQNADAPEQKQLLEEKLNLVQSQLTDAKTYYDQENNNDGQNVPMVLENSKYIKQEYSQVFAKDDDLGSR